MIQNIDVNKIPFAEFVSLAKFEKDLYDVVKTLLNNTYPHIKVKLGMILNPWDGNLVKVKNNASADIEKSQDFVEEIKKYISTRDDIGKIINSKISIVIDLIISEKEMKQEVKDEEKIMDFIPLHPRYNFEQIILDDTIKKEIFDAVKVIECKELIYNQWGFSEVDPIPRSILNFYGEPGTGKTMCAHAIANHLGKSILALNYSEIESKYVGEAPKNLQKAFEVAKETDSVLFFDEADSFLGKRIENVTQGADQALNSLRSQMLIQLEEFSGVVLFATNLVTNFDPAFESRILKHIRFELPNQEARAAILKKMIPSKLPVVSPFTDEQYMQASSLIDGFSGREIKGAILDLLLSKAELNNTEIVFSIDDLYDALAKKYKAKMELKAEEERRIKNKIAKKLKEKAAEAQALKNAENCTNAETEVKVEEETLKEKSSVAESVDVTPNK